MISHQLAIFKIIVS